MKRGHPTYNYKFQNLSIRTTIVLVLLLVIHTKNYSCFAFTCAISISFSKCSPLSQGSPTASSTATVLLFISLYYF